MCCVDDTTVMNILCHYFDENEIEEGGKANCNIVVSKPELTDEDKAELKEQAMEQFKQEQLRELRRQSLPKTQPKPTSTAPKAGAEIDSIPNLFDEFYNRKNENYQKLKRKQPKHLFFRFLFSLILSTA